MTLRHFTTDNSWRLNIPILLLWKLSSKHHHSHSIDYTMNGTRIRLFPVYVDPDMTTGHDLSQRLILLKPQMKWADNSLKVLQNNDAGYENVMALPMDVRKCAAYTWLGDIRLFMATVEAGLRHIAFSLQRLINAFEHTQVSSDPEKQARGYSNLQRIKTAWNNAWAQYQSLIQATCQKIDLVCLCDNTALHQHNFQDILPPGEVLRHLNLPPIDKKQMFWETIQLWEALKVNPRESQAYSLAYKQLENLTWRVRGGNAILPREAPEAFQFIADPIDPGDLSQVFLNSSTSSTHLHQQASSASELTLSPQYSQHNYLDWEGRSHDDFVNHEDLSSPVGAAGLDRTLDDLSGGDEATSSLGAR